VVELLLDAGAILIGKTNLDQFATGLNGLRSPYGLCRNLFDDAYIAGGSSSGSALAVAAGIVSFALGTDTAGSGRVPAAFNNIVGLKPTRGLLSTVGVVPACRSLDCVSVFGLTCEDTLIVARIAAGFDPEDAFSRAQPHPAGLDPLPAPRSFRVGVLGAEALEPLVDEDYARLYAESLARLEAAGGVPIEIDFRPFREAGDLLYLGPWVAERYLAFSDFLSRCPEAVHPVVRETLARGAAPTAAEAFAAFHRLRTLRRQLARVWDRVEVLATPTTAMIPTVEECLADPVRLNQRLGQYTHCVNLLGLAGLVVPAGFTRTGLPFGLSLVAPAFTEPLLCAIGARCHASAGVTLGATAHRLLARSPPAAKALGLRLCMSGAHMSGLPLNHELTARAGRFLERCRTAPCYRLYAFEDMQPTRPGLIREAPGEGIEVEVWELPWAAVGTFLAGVPAPLVIGTVELEDGTEVKGFLCEAHATSSGRDITRLGGWRAYLALREDDG
jgi:allophanate hydrolase